MTPISVVESPADVLNLHALVICMNLREDDYYLFPNTNRADSAFSVDNIQSACARLEGNGVQFQKKLTDGRQKNIAFALDPDNYWVQNHSREITVNMHEL